MIREGGNGYVADGLGLDGGLLGYLALVGLLYLGLFCWQVLVGLQQRRMTKVVQEVSYMEVY